MNLRSLMRILFLNFIFDKIKFYKKSSETQQFLKNDMDSGYEKMKIANNLKYTADSAIHF